MTELHFMQALIDAIPNPIFYKDVQGIYRGCNAAFADKVMGVPREEIVGRTVLSLPEAIRPESAELYHRQDLRVLASGGSQTYEAPVMFADGVEHQVLFNKSVLRDPEGKVTGMIAVMEDVSVDRSQESERAALLYEAEQRARRMQTAAEVSHAATSLLSLGELLPTAAELIRERFELYYVGIFLLSDTGAATAPATDAVLCAATGEAGRRMLADGHRLPWGSESMIGQCVATGEPGIALDVDERGASIPRFANPLLPETRSEMALPLISRHQVIGAMTIQSQLPNAFAEEDITILRTMTDQLANAIQNARLFERMDEAVRENEALVSELQHRATYLTAAGEVSQLSSSSLEEDRLLSESAELLCDRFGLDQVDIFIVDESRQWAILQASSSKTGANRSPGLLSVEQDTGPRMAVDRTSIVGRCILDCAPVAEEGQGTGSMNGSGGPALRLALPLINQGGSLGVLLVQSDAAHGFEGHDGVIFGTLADQLANAIANARLYREAQGNLEALQQLQRRYAMDMWDEYIEREDIVGYTYDLDAVMPLMTFEQMDLHPDRLGGQDGSTPTGAPLVHPGVEGGDGASLAQALRIRGQPVGLMSFEDPATVRDWSEDEVSVLDAVHEQLELALENRLLIDRSQRALQEARQRESELGFLQEVSALLNATNDVVSVREELFTRLQGSVSIHMMVLFGYDERTWERHLLGVVSPSDEDSVLAGIYADAASQSDEWGSDFVLATGTSVVQDDMRLNPRFVEDSELAASGIISRALLPLRLGARTLGVLELGSAEVNTFSRSGLAPILQQVAAQVASALERGNLLYVAQISADESRRLYEATSDLAAAMDAPDVLVAISRHAFPDQAVRAVIGLFVTDPETQAEYDWLEMVASYTSPSLSDNGAPVGTRTPASEVPALSLLGEQSIYVCEDVEADENLKAFREAHPSGGAGALLVVALSTAVGAVTELRADRPVTERAATERLGVLIIEFAHPQHFSEQDLRLYHTLSDQAAVVLSNRQLFQESQVRIARQAVAVELANLTTSLSERGTLLKMSGDFLQDRFGLYYVGIFLLDETAGGRQWAVLESGTGEMGSRLLTMGHRVQVGGGTMVGRTIQRGQRVLALDIDSETAMMENPLLPDMRSAVIFPLVSRGQTNGAVMLLSKRRFAFTQEDIAALELMVNQLANVIESTNLYERSQNSLAEIRMLYRIAQGITDAHDVDAILEAAVEGIAQRREPDWVIAGVFEGAMVERGASSAARRGEDTGVFRVLVSWSRDQQLFPVTTVPLDAMRQFYDMLRLDERFVSPDVTQDPMIGDYLRRMFADLGLRAAATFQLRVRGAPYGMVMISSRNAREFTMAELSFYENVTRQAYVALENISLVEVTQAQAEWRDVLNQVLQTASGSLEQETILDEVGKVIAERLDMPVMVWAWERAIAKATVTMARSLNVVAVYDAGGSPLSGDYQALTRSVWGLSDDSTNPGGHSMDAPTPSGWGALYRLIELRTPVNLSLEGAIANAPGTATGHGVEGRWFGGWRERFRSAPVEGYAIPLTARDVVYGVIVLVRSEGHPEVDDLEREFLRTAGANISVALETASLYREAQETAEKLKEVDALKNQFMANMSHELRTPLNSIIGFSRVMLRGIDGPLTEMQETDLSAIYDSGRHLLNLINDILDISKISAGKMEVVFEPVDVGAMIQSVMSTALGFVKDKAIKLLTDVPEDLPLVTGDARRIRQVLTNLLGNAGKFTEEGFIKVSASYDAVQLLISVQDTGIGIPSDRIHAVFEQFEQVDSSSTRRYGGTGLGVPLSREFVRLHGGDMWIQETMVGKGTTFCFSLPIGGPDSLSSDPRDVAVGEGNRVILTVDDDEGVITLFRRYLEQKGYRVFGLTRGERVVEEARRLKPFAITLDVIMPGKDGWKIIEDLKADPETRNIPVIVCSVLADKDKGLSMGVADYLVKPISEVALFSALERIEHSREDGYVLVVDDNPDDRKLLRRILENAGYEVSEVDGGATAIEAIHARRPALVVLDLMMPEVDGFAVLEHLKSQTATRQIPVVVVTAKELGTSERARLQQGVEALLQKGIFDQQQLLMDVTGALDRLLPTSKARVTPRS
jgi:GAF domain-containing protein/CheY-like chemotaxis protein